MSILLPSLPGPNDANPFYVDKGGILRPVGSGDDQKLNRLGDRFGIELSYPPLPAGEDGRIWISKLVLAQREGAIVEWPQLDFVVGNVGAPVVAGAGQAGMSINLRGFTPGYAVRDGQFFSIVSGGRRYLQMATADVSANGAGNITLPISPMLRPRPADGALCEFTTPRIEGFLEGNERGWNLSLARQVGISFRIMEAQ